LVFFGGALTVLSSERGCSCLEAGAERGGFAAMLAACEAARRAARFSA
jgi:hypothetical protein